jgi:membrane fusion protein, copper/silver efflux system
MQVKYAYSAILLIFIIAGSFLVGAWYQSGENPRNRTVAVKPSSAQTDPEEADSGLPGMVKISPEKQQMTGIKVEAVEKKSAQQVLRVLGRVAVDDTRAYRINMAVDGWITKTFDQSIGSLVKKGQTLAAFYSPEFLSAQQTYIFSLGSLDRVKGNPREPQAQLTLTETNIKQYKDTLKNIGMGDLQIEELARTRQFTENINITAPVTGIVMARSISTGERFEKGRELYRIADLSRIWILADIYGKEAGFFKPGLEVKGMLPDRGKTFSARVSEVLPLFDAATRTTKIRLEADNPGFQLRPDMFVDLEIPVTLPPAIAVPADAVLDSGLKKTVFVDRGKGSFEPREVETGWRMGNKVEITKGLSPGERIVTSGTFLIDSESRMEKTAQRTEGSMVKDPVSGADVSVRKAEKLGRKTTLQGKTYYFASEESKGQFAANPGRFLK